jgi:hypothetical protein
MEEGGDVENELIVGRGWTASCGGSAEVMAGFLRALRGGEVPADLSSLNTRGPLRNAGCEFGDDLIEIIGKDRVRKLDEIFRNGRRASGRSWCAWGWSVDAGCRVPRWAGLRRREKRLIGFSNRVSQKGWPGKP